MYVLGLICDVGTSHKAVLLQVPVLATCRLANQRGALGYAWLAIWQRMKYGHPEHQNSVDSTVSLVQGVTKDY
jgi:hypothetical protein